MADLYFNYWKEIGGKYEQLSQKFSTLIFYNKKPKIKGLFKYQVVSNQKRLILEDLFQKFISRDMLIQFLCFSCQKIHNIL